MDGWRALDARMIRTVIHYLGRRGQPTRGLTHAKTTITGNAIFPAERGALMLKIVMLVIGVFVMAPMAVAAFVLALPILPFVLIGFVLFRLIQSRQTPDWPAVRGASSPAGIRWSAYPVERSNTLAPLILGMLALTMIAQIKLAGFYWQIELGLGLAVVVVAAVWWAQHRLETRRQRRGRQKGEVAPHDLYRLFEIERTTDPDERCVLITRELNRLTREALRPDPALPSSWPSVHVLSALRDQVILLHSSASETSLITRTSGAESTDEPLSSTMMENIQTLENYVNQLLRVRLLGNTNLEQMRILVRDQCRLRAIQDEFVGEFTQSASVSAIV
jgi:hypothetical protein